MDNHDVNRIASTIEKKELLPAVYAMLFTMPGIPCIYYGSEWGMEGVKNANDTAIRPSVEKLESNELTEEIEKMIRIYRGSRALQNGDYKQIALNNGWCVYQRSLDGETVWCAINILPETVQIPVGWSGNVRDLASGEEFFVNGTLQMEPGSWKILQLQ